MQIRDVQQATKAAILHERRRNGPFASLAEFLQRTTAHVHAEEARILVKAGCFDRCRPQRPQAALLWEVLWFFRHRAQAARASLFAGTLGRQAPETAGAACPPDTLSRRLRHEAETLGLLLSAHPLDRYRDSLTGRSLVRARDLTRHAGRTVTILGWWITGKTVRARSGEPMQFVSFEDQSGLYEAVFFPGSYERYGHLLGAGRPYVLHGRVEAEGGAVTLNVQRLQVLTPAPDRPQPAPAPGAWHARISP